MEVGAEEVVGKNAFGTAVENIAIAGEDATERCGDIASLAAVIFKTNDLDGVAVDHGFDDDVADATFPFIGRGFGAKIEEVDAFNHATVGVFVVFAEELVAAADGEEEDTGFIGFTDDFFVF